MKKEVKRPVKIRKRWAINPKTKIKKSAKVYIRFKEKRKAREYEAQARGA